MTETDITPKQRRLLQRWHDGEATDDEAEEAERLVASSDAAEVYVDGLDRVGDWVRGAFERVEGFWDRPADEVADAALDAPPLEACDLETLAPMLERYYDGETGRVETLVVERLADAREDVDAYLERLERLGRYSESADAEARRRVDFERFADQVGREIDFDDGDVPDFDEERDAELLHRFADGELDDDREARVAEWIDDHPEAAERLDAIRDLGSFAEHSFEATAPEVDWETFHDELDDRLDGVEDFDDQPETGADVVSIDAHTDDGSEEREQDRGFRTWLTRTTNGTIAAAAAAALLVAAGVAVGQFVLGNRVVEKKVVIVDDVQHDDDSSVRVEGPMKQIKQNSDKDDSTIIWLKESNDADETEGRSSGDESDQSGDGAERPADPPSSGSGPDAGDGDTDDDQPI